MKKRLIAIGAALLMMTACTNNFDEINTNPNEPNVVPAEFLLTHAQESILDQIYGGFDNQRIGMTLAQYWSQNQYTEESRFQYRAGTNNTTWSTIYTGINNLQEIIRLNEARAAGRNENEIAVARIMKAWTYHFLTDVYGDIPYGEALNIAGGVVAPAYTPQQEIYQDLLKELTEASAQIDPEGEGFGSGDLVYGGDLEKWRKFANSLKMRVAIRMADRMPQQALAAIQEAVTAGVFTSNADNAAIQYRASQPNTNPVYTDVIVANRIDYSASDVLLNQLQSRKDPRLSAYFAPAVETGTFIGRPFGQNSANANALNADDVSQLSEVVLSPDFPGLMMDFAEVNFIMAEAKQRGAALPGTAAEYYNSGIRASIEFWEGQKARVGLPATTQATEAQIAAYIAANPYDPTNYKQSIGLQKWIALYTQGFQGWAEYRRLDFTGILKMPVDGPLISIDRVPLRREYPGDEQTLNPTNRQAAVDRQGPDALTTRLWWDVQ
jgi:hypothetical protein